MYIKNYEDVRVKILDNLGKYLKQQGMVFKERSFQCPNFKAHNNNDAKPSAMFFPSSDHYKCFSCNNFGDIFLVCHHLEGKPIEGPDFLKENFLYLAKKFNIPVEVIDNSPNKENDVLYEILSEAGRMMKLAINSGRQEVLEVRNYIEQRGWESLYDVYNFGYCNHTKLIKNLNAKGYTIDQITEAGLGLDNRILINDRLVFPVTDEYNRIIAFASRSFKSDSDELPRYMNSTNTKLYKKSDILFNMGRAKNNDTVYVVEGYADVFTLVIHGIENCVALCDLSFNYGRYGLLSKNGAKNIVFCLDSDEQGKNGLIKILREYFIQKHDLNIFIKEIPNDGEKDAEGKLINKDPDAYIRKYGLEAFNSIPETSLFNYFLKLYKQTNDVELQKDIFKVILNEESFITKEQLIKVLAEDFGVSKSAILDELRKVEQERNLPQLLKTSEILAEQTVLEREIIRFDEWSQRRGQLLGLNLTWFPRLSSKLDGLQSGFYIVGGRPNVGKSAFCLNLTYNLLKTYKDEIFIVYFSLDDNLQMVIPRLLALDTGLEINQVMNPVYRIQKNEELTEDMKEQLLKKRDASIEDLKKISTNIIIKDASHGTSIHYIDKMLKIYKILAENKKMVVVVDSFHKVTNGLIKKEMRETAVEISKTLKFFSTTYDIPIICTAELRKQQSITSRPDNLDIKEAVDLEYDSDVVLMLYSDFYDKDSSQLRYTKDNAEYPVVEINVTKNKKSPFRGKVHCKFIPQISQLVELSNNEFDNMVL